MWPYLITFHAKAICNTFNFRTCTLYISNNYASLNSLNNKDEMIFGVIISSLSISIFAVAGTAHPFIDAA